MTVKSLELARWAARSAVAVAFLFTTPAVLAQDDAAPAPESTETAPPADAAAPTEAAPAEGAATAAPETVDTIPVQTGETEKVPEGTRLDTIEVTGSRLKRTDYESAQPVLSISREDIERTGLTDISQILRHLTVAGNNSLSAQQGRFALSMGEVNLDLRNLGAARTLLLVNGRRWVTGLIATQPSVSDYNTIPTSIIERVEILKDGASAIYGSDAIGGVINVITRKDYEGFGLSYHLGHFVEEGDGINQQVNLNWGAARPGSSMFVNLSYTDQDRAPNESRSLTSSPASGIVRQSAVTTRGTYILINPTQNNASFYGCPNAPGLGASRQIPVSVPDGPTQVGAGVIQCTLQRDVGADPSSSTQTDYHEGSRYNPNPSPDDVYNRFGDGSLTEPNTRTSLFAQYSQDVLEGMNFTLEGLYNVRLSTSVGQRGYIGGGDRFFGVPGSKSYLGYLPETHPGNPFAQHVGRDTTCADQADPTCSHLGTGTGLWAFRLGGDSDNQNFHDEVQTLRLGGGLRGDIEFLSLPLSWDGGYIFARNKIEEIFPNPRFDWVAQALQNGEGPPCVAPCAPLDVFHGQTGISQAAVDFIFYDAYQRNSNQQDIGYFDLSGELPLLSWLAGPIAVATGVEFRRDQYESIADPIFQQGLIFMNSLTDTHGKTYSREAYLELGIPLVQGVPGVQALDLDIAGRYSRYPTFGDVTTGKAGLRWKPFDDLLVRSTYSTGFRAPNVGELYNGANQSFDGIDDPCSNSGPPSSTTNQNCAADGTQAGGSELVQPYDLWTGNPDLQPETSKNLTYGLVYSPQWLPGFDLNLDFYDIEIKDYITIGGEVGQYFLDSCYKTVRPAGAAPESGPHCEKIHRGPDGSLQYVDTPWTNFSARETSGIDGGINYLLPLPARFGRFKLGVEASYLKEYVSITPQGGGINSTTSKVGTVSGQFEGYPKWKAGAVLEWKGHLYSASWSTRMSYQMREPCSDFFDAVAPVSEIQPDLCSDPSPPIEDDPTTVDDPNTEAVENDETYVPYNDMKTVFYHNVQVTRELPGYNADITLGVNNVLDQDPPLSRSNIGIYWYNYDPNQYEPPGPLGYIRVGMKF